MRKNILKLGSLGIVLFSILAYAAVGSLIQNPVEIGPRTTTDKNIFFNIGNSLGTNPAFKANATRDRLQYSHDGVNYFDLKEPLKVKWIKNPNGENGTTGWAAYADAAGTSPVDGTGGSPTVSVGTSTLAGTTFSNGISLACNKPASNVQGQGCSYDFKIDEGMASKSQRIYMNTQFMTYNSSGSLDYVSGDMGVWIYNKDAGTLQDCRNNLDNLLYLNQANPSFSGATLFGKFQCSWYTGGTPSSPQDDYRLIFHQRTTNANAASLYHQITLFTEDTPAPSVVERSQDISLSGVGSFTGGSIRVSKVGRNVIISAISDITHASNIAPTSVSGIIPEWARPTTQMYNAYYSNGTTSLTVFVTADGVLTFNYNSARTGAGSPGLVTISYNVPGSEGNLVSTTELQAKTTDVWAVGNGGQAITATTTNIPFTEVRDSLSEWSGSTFTPLETGRYRWQGNKWYTTSASREIAVYEDGVSYKRFTLPVTNSAHGFVFEIDCTAGKVYALRAVVNGGTLSNAAGVNELHWLSIKRSYDPKTFGAYLNFEIKPSLSSVKTPGATNQYHSLTNNSVTLTTGTWKLTGQAYFGNNGAGPGYTANNVVWYGANGADNSTQPAALSTVATILSSHPVTFFSSPYTNTSYTSGLSNQETLIAPTVYVRIAGTQTIYLVTNSSLTTPGNALIQVSLNAERLQ